MSLPDDENNRETGGRIPVARPGEVDRDKAGLEQAENRRSGLRQPADETMEKTRQSDSVDQGTLGPAGDNVPESGRRRSG
jgi:hypothetical protein